MYFIRAFMSNFKNVYTLLDFNSHILTYILGNYRYIHRCVIIVLCEYKLLLLLFIIVLYRKIYLTEKLTCVIITINIKIFNNF